MRSLILTAVSTAALLAAGSAFAQSPPNMTTQTASSHSALIDQIGGTTDKASIHQDDAGVATTGVDKDAAVVIQGGPGFASGSSNNVSKVDQTGVGQRALTMQSTNGGAAGNAMTVTQTGDHNRAFGYQFGSGNTATLTQGMTGNPSTSALNDQGVASSNDNQKGINAAVALRTRTTQQARSDVFYARGAPTGTIVQDWALNDTATLNQTGTKNTGLAIQSYENGSTATLTQAGGTNNNGYIFQQGSAGTGSGNTASLTETGGSRTSAMISQIDSIGSVATTTTNGNSISNAYTYQQGSQNSATVSQTSVSFGTADISQTAASTRRPSPRPTRRTAATRRSSRAWPTAGRRSPRPAPTARPRPSPRAPSPPRRSAAAGDALRDPGLTGRGRGSPQGRDRQGGGRSAWSRRGSALCAASAPADSPAPLVRSGLAPRRRRSAAAAGWLARTLWISAVSPSAPAASTGTPRSSHASTSRVRPAAAAARSFAPAVASEGAAAWNASDRPASLGALRGAASSDSSPAGGRAIVLGCAIGAGTGGIGSGGGVGMEAAGASASFGAGDSAVRRAGRSDGGVAASRARADPSGSAAAGEASARGGPACGRSASGDALACEGPDTTAGWGAAGGAVTVLEGGGATEREAKVATRTPSTPTAAAAAQPGCTPRARRGSGAGMGAGGGGGAAAAATAAISLGVVTAASTRARRAARAASSAKRLSAST